MAYDKQKVIDIAQAEVGYLEKETNSNLDSKTGNAGDENYTKYARDLAEVGFFNGRKQGRAWCAVFTAWNFWKAFGKEAALQLLCQPEKDNCGAGCGYAFDYFKRKGRIFSSPQPGDLIFFWSKDKKTKSHIGLVYAVDRVKVYTLEGNTSGAAGVVANGGGVFRKSYNLSYARIAGYGRPDWGASVKAENQPVKAPTVEDKEEPAQAEKTPVSGSQEGKTIMIELNTQRNGSKGEQVKTIQRLLKALGQDCGKVDGVFGSQTLKAVKAFQKAEHIDADGVVGRDTWTKLLK